MFVDVQIFIKHDQTRCCFVTKECLIAKGSISHFGRSLQTNATLWNGSAIKHNIDDLIYALSLVFLGILPRDSYSRLCLARDDIWSHRVSGRAFKTREEMLNEEIQCKMKKKSNILTSTSRSLDWPHYTMKASKAGVEHVSWICRHLV